MKIVLITVLSMVVGQGTAGGLQAPQDLAKPVQTDVIYTRFYGPPDSLSEMITKADAVVRGRIVGAAPLDLDLDQVRGGRVMTVYRFAVLEIMHTVGGHIVDPHQIVILREGGQRDRGSFIQRVVQDGFPPFEHGHEYLVFLRWDAGKSAWLPAFGPDSVVDLQGGRVESPGSAKITSSQKGRLAADYLKSIRQYGRD
jgi:hypothetical protein